MRWNPIREGVGDGLVEAPVHQAGYPRVPGSGSLPTLRRKILPSKTDLSGKDFREGDRGNTPERDNIVELKRLVKDLGKKVSLLEGEEAKRLSSKPAPEEAEGTRFSPAWLKTHRTKLGLSAEDYALLVGVYKITIYNWEKGKSKPRQEQLASLVAVRRIREANAKLELLKKAGEGP